MQEILLSSLFVDETNIPNMGIGEPNMGIGEPNIVIETSKSTKVSQNNVNKINNGHTSKESIAKT